MQSTPSSASGSHDNLAASFTQKLILAVVAMRLSEPTDPQVAERVRAVQMTWDKLQELDNTCCVEIGYTSPHLVVNGRPLPDNLIKTGQQQKFITFLKQNKLQTLTFTQAFNQQQCSAFIACMSSLDKGMSGEQLFTDQLHDTGVDSVRINVGNTGTKTTENLESSSPPPDLQPNRKDSQNAFDHESHIFELAAQGKEEEAKQMLCDLVYARARSGEFEEAERLRDRLYEIDPLALPEIIKTGEIIEQEKSDAIAVEDKQAWAEIASICTDEEFSSLYHSFEQSIYQPEENIVTQGSRNDTLIFINQGTVKVAHKQGNREIFITALNKGDLIGENFFTPSVWTVTLTALTKTSVMTLSQKKLESLEKVHAGLRKKLHDFYPTDNGISSILKKRGLERREHKRFRISRKVQVIPLNSSNQAVGRGFRADITDISKGGLAFVIRISKRENTKLLLGRPLQVVLPVGGSPGYIYLQGKCIGVQEFNAFESDYSVHLQFDEQVPPETLRNIIG